MSLILITVYYALWAQMLDWPIAIRAAVVLFIFFGSLYFSAFILLKILSIFILGCHAVNMGVYFVTVFIVDILIKKYKKAVVILNSISSRMGIVSERFIEMSKILWSKHRIPVKYFIALYFILIMLIALPQLSKNIISPQYAQSIGVVCKIYSLLEKDTLEKAKEYEPLFHFKKAENDIKEDTIEQEVWLSLSELGEGGSNIRSKADKESHIITIVKGNTNMLYLDKVDGWIYIQLETGEEGWIRDYLVKGLPE